MVEGIKVLQIGLGGFGQRHVAAWSQLGLADSLFVAELDPTRHAMATRFAVPARQIGCDYRVFLAEADVVDIVTDTRTHRQLCEVALQAGKDVFVEKPMTLNATDARALAELVRRSGRTLQVGFYYRFHPATLYVRDLITGGELGELRYLDGEFRGFKRARTDVGVMHTDGIHFIDLFNWLLRDFPARVYAVTRDHFRRGLEDLAIALFEYPSGVVAKVEAGYIQPGQWKDKVVPGAMTTKTVTICGSRAAATIDFETEQVTLYDVHHELINGVWTAVNGGSRTPPTGSMGPVEQVAAEFQAFLQCVHSRTVPGPDVIGAGLNPAVIVEGLYQSARSSQPVTLNYQ